MTVRDEALWTSVALGVLVLALVVTAVFLYRAVSRRRHDAVASKETDASLQSTAVGTVVVLGVSSFVLAAGCVVWALTTVALPERRVFERAALWMGAGDVATAAPAAPPSHDDNVQGAASSAARGGIVRVRLTPQGVVPQRIVITPGTTVRWTNETPFALTVTSAPREDGEQGGVTFNSGLLSSSDAYEHTFDDDHEDEDDDLFPADAAAPDRVYMYYSGNGNANQHVMDGVIVATRRSNNA